MDSSTKLKLFSTPAHTCSYLPEKQATTIFVDPLAKIDKNLYSRLSLAGFRRSGAQIYRPYCKTCTACIPVRIPVNRFSDKRKHRRTRKANESLIVTKHRPKFTQEYFSLYEKYITERHSDGDMYPPSPSQFKSFLVDARPETSFYEFRESGQLLAIAVADEIENGLSAIYTFFDTCVSNKALGVFAILWLVDEARKQKLEFLYLGYWIKESPKMNYKSEYKPIEFYVNNKWSEIER